ncbi:beta-glucosidase [Streptomonospora nanhaiensis]|uniref:Beta-glucosidase n=1 Tax=Streptomonospora nanhaiensis TaxID=1323731 RepID=A0A853BUW4_9ACTN|nr:beta-glucosidase [Streptomonospora nanhaiensis]
MTQSLSHVPTAAEPIPGTATGAEAAVRFPADFVWGASTASFQIEGSTTADGRGPSIWDTFANTPGKVLNGDTGEPAVDHYRRYAEDIGIMRELGIGAYRFSVAWPRILPEGAGAVNQAGLDFYDRLLDGLLAAGITPWPTLYHWDLPQALEDKGGWPNRDTAYRFAEYAEVLRDRFGDRVSDWTTLNEPWCAAFLGYADGVHAPGRREPAAALAAAHHLMLGHGLAAAVLREGAGGGQRRVGLTLNQTTVRPYTTSPADIAVARRADGVRNRVFTGPLFRGAYPADMLEDLAAVSDFAFVRDGDLAVINAPLDHLGVNYYTPHWVSASSDGIDPSRVESGGDSGAYVGCDDVVFVSQGLPRTGIGWEIDATGLYEVLVRLAAECPGVPMYVHENGAAYEDEVGPDGQVHDPERTAYIDAHLRTVHEALKAGVPMRGYFVWSLLDNFEWAWGYSQRFGLVHVDYETQQRRVKDSGRWYADVIRRGGLAV